MSELLTGEQTFVAQNDAELVQDKLPKTRTIGFWTSIAGQDMIDLFGGSSDSRALSTWLAQWYPGLYGVEAGLNNLSGQRNRSVAAFVQVTEIIHGPDSEACRTLAAALDDFATISAFGE